MTTKVLDLNNIERKLFWAFASFFAIAISFYLYSVLSLTLNVVERDRTASAVRELALKEVAVKFAGNTGTKISLAR